MIQVHNSGALWRLGLTISCLSIPALPLHCSWFKTPSGRDPAFPMDLATGVAPSSAFSFLCLPPHTASSRDPDHPGMTSLAGQCWAHSGEGTALGMGQICELRCLGPGSVLWSRKGDNIWLQASPEYTEIIVSIIVRLLLMWHGNA